MFIPDIHAGKLVSMPPVDRLIMRKMTINWLLTRGYEWGRVFIDYESVRFKVIKNGKV
jgi:hypothetical protein